MRRVSSLAVMLAVAIAPVAARAQPVDPYADHAPPPKAKPKGKGKQAPAPAPAPASGPQDPYGDAAPASAPAGPQDPYGQQAPAPAPAPTGPQDPYGSQAPAAPPPAAPRSDAQTSDVDEAVAAALVTRAHHLIDVQAWADAKQLAVEALVRSPGGPSAADANEIVRIANQRLGIVDTPPPPPHPIEPATHAEPATGGVTAHAAAPTVPGRTVLAGYGLPGGALLGLGVVGAGSGISKAGGDAAGIAIGALAGGGLAWWLGDRYDVTFTEARTVGAGATWGAVEFGLLTDVVGGAGEHTTHDEVAVGASIGLALGTVAGIAYAKDHTLTSNDITLVDSLGAMGAFGGFAVGELMQPYANEAYTLNAAIGTAGGVVIGLWLAPDTEISTQRMLRVDAVASLGAGIPWALYGIFHSSSTTADERVFGLLSAGGMLTGLYVGLRWTRDYDDKHLSAKPKALEVGALGVRPPTTTLAPNENARGLVVDLLRGSF